MLFLLCNIWLKSVFDSSCSLSNILLNKQSCSSLCFFNGVFLIGRSVDAQVHTIWTQSKLPVCQLRMRESWPHYCFPPFSTKHTISDASTNFAYILTPCMTAFASWTYGSNWRSYLPPFPLNWNLQNHKLQNQLHVSKAEVDNLCITAKSHWFGESSVVLSAAWRLPWPGGEYTSQRSNAVQWMRCVGHVVGSWFSVNTGKTLWLNEPLSQNIGVYYRIKMPYCGNQLYL